MTIDPLLLELLVCPDTRAKVALADDDTIAALNALIDKGRLDNKGGDRVRERLEAALIREDGALCYPVRGDIPVMLAEEAILLDQLGG